MNKKYDVILYGATGFTGVQTVKYFAYNASKNINWAIAGRNKTKLEKVKEDLGSEFSDLPIFVADALDYDSISDMVKQSKVILTTAGPFAKYGENIIKACVNNNCHYVDITGETPFIKKMIDKYHQKAVENSVKIIPFCGFDSVPSDLGSFFLIEEAKKKNLELESITSYFKMSGGFNGGTIASAINLFEEDEIDLVNNPDLLTPDNSKNIAKKDNLLVGYDSDMKFWTAPFFMAPVNTRVVRRSSGLFDSIGKSYSEKFSYDEYMYFKEPIPLKSGFVSSTMSILNLLGKVKSLVDLSKKFAPEPGTGPSEKTMDNGFFKTLLKGKTKDKQIIKAELYCKGDPGNRVTVKILCESALCLVEDQNRLPNDFSGGILTTATAFGHVLIDRLKEKKFSFKII